MILKTVAAAASCNSSALTGEICPGWVRPTGDSPVITAVKTQAERYVPSIEGCEPSLEYRVENAVEPTLGSTPVSATASYRCL